MSEQSTRHSDCDRLERLELFADPAALSAEDRAFREAHLASCASCRSELAVLEELRFDGSAPAARPLDELSRRRAIQDIVEAAGQGSTPAEKPARNNLVRRRLLAAGGLAACLLAALAVLLWPRDGHLLVLPTGAQKQPVAARVLLRSGDAMLAQSPLRLDDRLRPGQRLESRSGRAALRLPQGSTLLLDRDTVLSLDRLARNRVQLHLERGQLLASVTRRQQRQVFEVRTPSGRITVKGTAFSLLATRSFTLLRVLRGVVVAHEPGKKPQEVRPGRLVVMGKSVAASLSSRLGPAGQQRTARVLWLLPPVDTDRRHATLNLRTTPPGARVLVDGTVVGVTPLAARLEPGQRRVTVMLAGYDTVQESLPLEPDGVTNRHFELRRSPVVAVAPAPGPSAATVQPQTVPRPSSHGKSAPASAVPSARTLLERAQNHRAARRWSGAVAAYRELIRRHPTSPEGRASLVSVGIILLGPGQSTKGALRAFDRYLALTRRGDLAQEATYGRARALRRLGRSAAEILTLRDFLKRWPKALQAPQAQKRLRRLTNRGVK